MRPADIQGQARAWRMQDRLVARPDDPSEWQGTIASWLLEGRGFNVSWHWWTIGALHLRPIPGVRPPYLQFAEATHEFFVLSVYGEPDPDATHPDDVIRPPASHILMPPDFMHQVGGITDEQAAHVVEGMCRLICDGKMSPNEDHRKLWRATINKTVEHLVLGGHAKAGA